MAISIKDTVIQSEAILGVKDNLLNAQKATAGAIEVGKKIHKGDYINESFFSEFGNVTRRDPSSSASVTPARLSSLEDVAVKLYFKNDLFVTNTELERYGSSISSMNKKIGEMIGNQIARWALNRGLIALGGALTSQANLIAGDGTTDASVALLNDANFKFGDMNGDIVSYVAPSLVAHKLIGNAIGSTADQISYGGVYKGTAGTLGRNLWTVDNSALSWVDGENSGNYAFGLTKGALSIDESEIIKILSALDITQENSGYRFKAEGAYTVNIKGFAYKTAQGINPNDTTLGSVDSWDLISTLKQTAGVVAKSL